MTHSDTDSAGVVGLNGLSDYEVAERIRSGQTNAYKETTSRSAASIVRANVFTIFNAILGAALVLVLLFGHWADALFGFVLVLNTLTGTLAEVRAKRALDRLAVLQQPRAHVVRDGQDQDINVAEVVLDDVLRLRAGEQVPADGEVLMTEGLELDESILTGESVPVRPAPADRVMSGTTVTAGSALVRVTAVGAHAYAHRLAAQARQYSTVTSELQVGTNRVLTWISWVIAPVALLLAWSQIRHAGGWEAASATGQWRLAMVAAIAGVVGMVPQGLVLLTSVNFATASLKLARRSVLVQELPAVEVLARVDTLCLDKTGTLTTGGITLRQVLDAEARVIESFTSAEAGELVRGVSALVAGKEPNATALAVRQGLAELTGRAIESQADWDSDASVPFSSRRKWSAVRIGEVTWVMGAPEIILGACTHADDSAADPAVARIAATGGRVIAVARAQQWCEADQAGEWLLPEGLTFSGLLVLAEQVRPDAKSTLDYFRTQGVEVKIISGDNPTTVAAVARRAGVEGPGGVDPVALDARELPTEIRSEDDRRALADALEEAQVLGRVTPEQKRALVQALQGMGRTVAMTGDGVNDALALKDADLGIAMGNGAPATKAVARLVLASGEFSALPGVVGEGRRVMANTERIASLFLSKTVYASLIAVIVAISGIEYLFLPRQLTIVSSLTIGVPAFVLALAPNPRRYRSGFLTRVLALAVPAGLLAGACTLLARIWLVSGGSSREQVTTGATLVLVAGGLALLTLTARPLLGWRLGLICLMGSLAVVGVLIPAVRSFFLLAWPTPSTWVVVGTMTALVLAGMGAVHLLRGVIRSRWDARLSRTARR